MAQFFYAFGIADWVKRTKRKRLSNTPYAKQFLNELALTNRLFREKVQSKNGLFTVDLGSIPELFTVCDSPENFLVKTRSLKRLLTVSPDALKKLLGTSHVVLDNASLKAKILGVLGVSTSHVSAMFADVERIVNSRYFNVAASDLEGLTGTDRKDTQALWDATLKLASYALKECGATLAHENLEHADVDFVSEKGYFN